MKRDLLQQLLADVQDHRSRFGQVSRVEIEAEYWKRLLPYLEDQMVFNADKGTFRITSISGHPFKVVVAMEPWQSDLNRRQFRCRCIRDSTRAVPSKINYRIIG